MWTVIMDLDGTLCDTAHRKHHVEGKKKNFKAFHDAHVDDKPNDWCKALAQSLCFRYFLILVTGRPEEYRESTKKWLKANGIPYADLYMRKMGDYRADYIIKEEILDAHILPHYKVRFAIDDRQQVVDMWRRRGIVCLQCADGNF